LLGPIFNREFLTVPRRGRHYVARTAYLGTLWVIGLTVYQFLVGWTHAATLGETARFGALLFQLLTFLQLTLFLFFSALSSASAVALEKDRRTFILLLLTDLRNHEIVLGKVLGSLLSIWLLLGSTVPVLMLLLLLGGTGLEQVLQAVVVVAASSLAAGCLGGLIALWRDRTFQSLALTVLLLVLYLCVVQLVALVVSFIPALAGVDVLSWLDPFQALRSVHDPLTAGALPAAYGFALVMVLLSAALMGWGVWRLRVWNPSGEPIQQREQPDEETEAKERAAVAALSALRRRPARELVLAAAEKSGGAEERRSGEEISDSVAPPRRPAAPPPAEGAPDRASVHAAPGRVRQVGANPILWREIYTRAYGNRPLLVKIAYFIVLAFIGYFALVPLVARGPYPFAAAYGLAPVGVLSLLLVAAQAATSITSERDTGALDLLLVTDLSPREFIFGKLGGVLYNTKEYLIPPLALAVVYACFGALARPPAGHPELAAPMNVTAVFCVLGGLLVLMAFAMVLGLHVALRTHNSGTAVVHTLGTIFFLSLGTLFCVALIVISGRFEYQWLSFIFFIGAGIGGLWWVLNGRRPSGALTWASWFCPLAVLYAVMNVVVAKPGSQESGDPLAPFVVVVVAFGFTITAMLVPLLSEFDVALGRTTGGNE
jgi:ABC-type transport system involved in multi-copper enzyme maturation permease subunit